MGRSFFIWKNKDCRAMGCYLATSPAIIRPEERVKHIEIPGRPGDLTMLEGEDIFNSYIQTVSLIARGSIRIREIYDWLRGSGYVTFGPEPDRKQMARIIGAITLQKHSHNLDWWEGEVQFYCQPFKEALTSKTDTITSSGSTVYNAGDVVERPKIKMTASATTASIVINSSNSNTLLATNLTSSHVYEIDTETMEMIDLMGYTLVTSKTVGNFPVFTTGTNTITGSGWSKLEITRRERFL